MNGPSEKTKLTLGINKEIISRAKASGINISAITEQLLRAMTFEPKQESLYEDVIKSYEAFLAAITQVLRKYNIVLNIGVRNQENIRTKVCERISVSLDGDGTIFLCSEEGEQVTIVSVNEVFNDLHPVNHILNNLLTQLIDVTEVSKQKLQELKFASKLLKSLSEDEIGDKN